MRNGRKLVKVRHLWRTRNFAEALVVVNSLLEQNPCAAQLHLLKGMLEQLQPDASLGQNRLRLAEKSLLTAYELDRSNLDAIVELMHFYHAVCPAPAKARRFALKVVRSATQALAGANEILHETKKSMSRSRQ